MISKRLARLEAALVRPAEPEPVDMRPVRAQLDFLLAGAAGKGRNSLERLSAAMRCSPMGLWKLATTHHDRRKFARLYEPLERHSGTISHRTTSPSRSSRNSFARNCNIAFARSASPSTAAAGCRYVG
jgi:hypothetical protein